VKTIEFVPKAFKEYQDWIETDRRTALRIGDLIKDILRQPYEGIGKPEPERKNLQKDKQGLNL
jgi:toxin YoeB